MLMLHRSSSSRVGLLLGTPVSSLRKLFDGERRLAYRKLEIRESVKFLLCYVGCHPMACEPRDTNVPV